jgi:nicotinamide-nucleotide amidase
MGETHPSSGVVAEIVTTGTEILLGDIVDTNAAWIAQQLRDVGVNLYYKTTVGDNEVRLRGVLEQGIGRSDVIIVTGGLGPTVDDITRQAVANATQRPLRRHDDAMAQLEARFLRFGSKMTENNRQQAFIPEGATLIPNPVGTAPGFIAEAGRCAIVALPGVPSEMKHLMNETVLPWLRARAGGAVIRRRILRTIGIGESTIDSQLDDLERQSNPTVGLAAHLGQADVRIAARADSDAAAERMLDEVEAEVRRRIGDYIYSTTPGETFEAVVCRRLLASGLRIALLETNTGGAIARRLAAATTGESPVVMALVAMDPGMPEAVGRILAQASKPAEEIVRRAAVALREVSGADINIAIIGTTGASEGIYGTHPGETWMAEADRRSTQAARLPVGGTDAFTTVRIGNYALRMIDDGVTELAGPAGR